MITMSCCVCYIEFGIPDAMHKRARELGNFKIKFYCPVGHEQGFGESEIDKERRARQRAEQEQARLADEAAQAKRKLATTEKVLASHKKRAAAGVCPCCNRTVSQMARHMKTQHPDYNVVPLKSTRA